MAENDGWLTTEEVAEQLKVKPATVTGWLRDGRLKGSNLGKKAGWRVKQSDVDAFMEKRKNAVNGRVAA